MWISLSYTLTIFIRCLCISFFRYSHVSTKIIARKPSYFCGREGISEDKIPWKQLKHWNQVKRLKWYIINLLSQDCMSPRNKKTLNRFIFLFHFKSDVCLTSNIDQNINWLHYRSRNKLENVVLYPPHPTPPHNARTNRFTGTTHYVRRKKRETNNSLNSVFIHIRQH